MTEIAQAGAQPLSGGERLDAGLNSSTSAAVMGRLSGTRLGCVNLMKLHGELEARGRASDPSETHVRSRLTVKVEIHLHGVEAFGVEVELVEARLAVGRPRVKMPFQVPLPVG